MRSLMFLIVRRIFANDKPRRVRVFGATNFHFLRRQIKSFAKYLSEEQTERLIANTLISEDAFGDILRAALHAGTLISDGRAKPLNTPVEWFGVFKLLISTFTTCELNVVLAINAALKAEQKGIVGLVRSLFYDEHATAEARRAPGSQIWTRIGCGLAGDDGDPTGDDAALPDVSAEYERESSEYELTRSRVRAPPKWASSLACSYCRSMPQRTHVSLRHVCGACAEKAPERSDTIDWTLDVPHGIPHGIASARGFFMCMLQDIVTTPHCSFLNGATFHAQRAIVEKLHAARHIDDAERTSANAIIRKYERRVREFVTQVLLENVATIGATRLELSRASGWLECMCTMLGMFAECDVELGAVVTPLLIRGGRCAAHQGGADKNCPHRHETAASREQFKAHWGAPGCWRAGL